MSENDVPFVPLTQKHQALKAMIFDNSGVAFAGAAKVTLGASTARVAAVRMRRFPPFSRRYSGYDPGPRRP
ncbi:hypothetical protein [Extensimonas sp. H3M7-6]|uniref:hypothetical protein n=1 Tax=Extensimonas soli TaxID=3031322 RepID=UPI0023DC8CA0|nr:hypothetical protein [Extensimonas sp. H3M7-6]MDF1481938.1 hypothetical protein [Extensimonas sp. H3M7-6]